MNNTEALKGKITTLPVSSQGGAVAVTQNRFTAIVETQSNEYINLWGGKEKATRFMQSFVSALMQNPDLANCTPESIRKAGIDCAISGLTPGNVRGEAYLIKYGAQCQLQIGYTGYRKMFYRSPLAKVVKSFLVYENDYFNDHGNYHDYPEFVRVMENRGKLIAVFCVAELSTGGILYEKMSVQEVIAWRNQYSPGWNRRGSAWQSNFEGMAKKTVLVKVLKDCPMEDIQMAITQEEKQNIQPFERADLLGEADKPDQNEIVIEDSVDSLKSAIISDYRELFALLPDEWNAEEAKQHNEKMLGVTNLNNCDDINKLKALSADLGNRIAKFNSEMEVYDEV